MPATGHVGTPPYVCGQLLAVGSFGSVFRARPSDATGKDVCLKLVPLAALSDEQLCEALCEVEMLAALRSHPNIVKFITSYRHDDCLVIVTELATGGDLGALIERQRHEGRRCPELDIWRIFTGVCKGLEHIHARRILHRDIKPSNIFLDSSGRAMLGDLGMGRVLLPHERWASTCAGTPIYFAPEIVAGRPYDERADVWALGCVVYELACLEPPFAGADFRSLADRILTRSPAPLPPGFSPELRHLVDATTAKDPARRPLASEMLGWPAVRVRDELAAARYEVKRLRELLESHKLSDGTDVADAKPPPVPLQVESTPAATTAVGGEGRAGKASCEQSPSVPPPDALDATPLTSTYTATAAGSALTPRWETPQRHSGGNALLEKTVTLSVRRGLWPDDSSTPPATPATTAAVRSPSLLPSVAKQVKVSTPVRGDTDTSATEPSSPPRRGAGTRRPAMWSPTRLGPPLRVPKVPRRS